MAELTSAERLALQRLAAQERARDARPWESGVPAHMPHLPPIDTPQTGLDAIARVELLSRSFDALCEMLVEAKLVDGDALAVRIAALKREVDAAMEARRETDARVVCAGCGTAVPRDEVLVRATGFVCVACHTGRRAAPEGERPANYREAPGAVAAVETIACARCNVVLERSDAYHSAVGEVCARCHVIVNDS